MTTEQVLAFTKSQGWGGTRDSFGIHGASKHFSFGTTELKRRDNPVVYEPHFYMEHRKSFNKSSQCPFIVPISELTPATLHRMADWCLKHPDTNFEKVDPVTLIVSR